MKSLARLVSKFGGAAALFNGYLQVHRPLPRQRRANHGLPGELIVSLTSYPKRFGALHLTLRSLLLQDVRPDAIILWIGEGDFASLPARVLRLRDFGLTIRTCEDMRSYTKIVPSLIDFPEAFILTVDDDIYYPPSLVGTLARSYEPGTGIVTCRRAHGIMRDPSGAMAPYLQWDGNFSADTAGPPSTEIMPTGVGGVLYPPHSLHPNVTDVALFRKLAPTADDLWLFWMGRMAGTRYRKVGGACRTSTWFGSQATALHLQNNQQRQNDEQIGNLERHFGAI